jgi:outer membrane protein assembly factor BamB
VYALNPGDGSIKWSNNCANNIGPEETIAYGGDTGFVYVGTVTGGTQDGRRGAEQQGSGRRVDLPSERLRLHIIASGGS